MPTVRLANTFLTILMITLVTMILASPASAVEFELGTQECGEGTKWGFCWAETETSPLLELIGTKSVTVLGGESLLNVSELGVEILCKKAKDAGNAQISQPTPLGSEPNLITGSLIYEECAFEGEGTIAKLCVVPASERTNELRGELTSETNLHVVPKSGAVFIEFEIKSKSETEKCPATVVGKRKITGSQDLTITNPGHTLSSKSATVIANSGLLFIEKHAELTGSITITLTGFEDWFDISGGTKEKEECPPQPLQRAVSATPNVSILTAPAAGVAAVAEQLTNWLGEDAATSRNAVAA